MKLRKTERGALMKLAAWGGLGALLTTVTRSVLADPLPAQEAFVEPPGRSVAANDQSSAIHSNPANLGFLVSTEGRWTWVRTSSGAPATLGRGHAFDLAFPLPWHIGTGFRLDFMRPNENPANFPINRDYAWFTWALGIAPSPAWSVGFSI